MRDVRVAILVALAGCKDPAPSTPKDAPPPDAEEVRGHLTTCDAPIQGTTIATRAVTKVGNAMLATAPRGDARLFIVEQAGAIRIFDATGLRAQPFLDLSEDAGGPVAAGGEMGLLGLAFHPAYATTGTFFIFYTRREAGDAANPNRDVVARCQVSAADPDRAEPACVEILAIPDFAGNHNGGMIEFGSDGLLYIGTGDGGGAGDPQRTAQNRDSLLGKLLRIDVDNPSNGREYGIPSTNPHATGGGAPELFMLGLRNPWRWSFDRETGDLWIGDVGQSRVEELTVLRPAQQLGANLGWSMYEGSECFHEPCDPANKMFPQDERLRGDSGWSSIVAGQTYRGRCFPALTGWHFYTDYGAGGLYKARLLTDDTLEIQRVPGTFPSGVASIHESGTGELYLTTTTGHVHAIEVRP